MVGYHKHGQNVIGRNTKIHPWHRALLLFVIWGCCEMFLCKMMVCVSLRCNLASPSQEISVSLILMHASRPTAHFSSKCFLGYDSLCSRPLYMLTSRDHGHQSRDHSWHDAFWWTSLRNFWRLRQHKRSFEGLYNWPSRKRWQCRGWIQQGQSCKARLYQARSKGYVSYGENTKTSGIWKLGIRRLWLK